MDIELLAESLAKAITDAFDLFHTQFKAFTRRAKLKFETRDWIGAQQNAAERLDLYKNVIDSTVTEIRAALDTQTEDKYIWMKIKRRYSELIAGRDDFELIETFFNSITRKIFSIAGVDADIEYISSEVTKPPLQNNAHDPSDNSLYRRYLINDDLSALMKRVLGEYQFTIPYQDLALDAQLIVTRMREELGNKLDTLIAIEMVDAVFYRNKGAYIIGRLCFDNEIIPLALPLLNYEQGIVVDAVLLTQNEVSIVFSFTRSYFLVEVERPHEMIYFLKTIMPLKPLAELYIAIGYNKHGKTELYRGLLNHLEQSDDKFEIARGKRGMVMSVFTLPSYDVVFKVIKDKPAFPKTSTRKDVIDKYNLVFMHDRAGRLVDAQEFEHLKFDRDRFSDELLAELSTETANSVTITESSVIIKHLYTERKLSPLNLYVKESNEQAALDAIIDYGSAIKEIVAANLFPGDILLKNFGVTRHGRVVFYDYDEICLLTECNFRAIPAARNFNDELDAEPWFYVGENDIFPEEFKSFLELEGELRAEFLKAHGDLFCADFWLTTQQEIREGTIHDIFPYRQQRRLRVSDSLVEMV